MGPIRSFQTVSGRGILRSLPGIHRQFIAARYGIGGVGLTSEQLLLLSRAARWFPLDPPFSLASIHRSAWKGHSANFAVTESSEVRYTQAMSNNSPFGGCA